MSGTAQVGTQVCLYDDFLGAALRGEVAGTTENSGSAAIAAGVEGGVAALVTGATSGNRSQLTTGLNHRPLSGGVQFSTRVKSTATATRALFVGFTDTVSLEMPIEISAGTVTANATDAVGFVYDTAGTDPGWRFIAVKGGVVNEAEVQLADGEAPALSTEWQNFMLYISHDGHVTGSWGEDVEVPNRFGVRELVFTKDMVNPNILYTPIVAVETRDNSAATAQVDYFSIESARDGR